MPFRTIAGHQRILALLSRAIVRDTLPPSLLLAGPEGVGKRMVALALAEAVNCQSPVKGGAAALETDACGTCTACKRIARGNHPDVLLVEPGDMGSIKIEAVREVIDRAGYRPFEGRRRVVIVDDADALVPAAQNALLKTLEEPPSASVFVLVSSMPDALLPTVRSRCPRLRFGPLPAADVAGVLMRDHEYSEPEARAAAADADGSIGRALDAQSADLETARNTARRLLTDTARMADPSRRMLTAKDLTGTRSTPAGEREQMGALLRALSSLLRDLGAIAAGADARTLANADLAADLTRLSASYDGRRSVRAFCAVDEALASLDHNASPKVVADWLVLQL